MGEWGNCMMTHGNQCVCSEPFVVYTNIDLLYCIRETTIMLYSNFTSVIKKMSTTITTM